jgi:hypothetical protein
MAAETGADDLIRPDEALGVVVLATDGPGRRHVAEAFERKGLATLLVDVEERQTDLGALVDHLITLVDGLADRKGTAGRPWSTSSPRRSSWPSNATPAGWSWRRRPGP